MIRIITGDCLAVMPTLEAESVGAICSDPPYGLGFMGKDWDHGIPGVAFWAEALRVAKPGAHLVAFGGTRTFHRLTVAIEDAGWEIRDCLSWLYGSGFPKSHSVSKSIESLIRTGGSSPKNVADAREQSGQAAPASGEVHAFKTGDSRMGVYRNKPGQVWHPTLPAAKQWEGWGTALKPAWEPIILARKPFPGTVAGNVLAHGTGAVNVDGCRVGTSKDVPASAARDRIGQIAKGDERGRTTDTPGSDPNVGRWPANVILDEEAAGVLDEQSGITRSTGGLTPGVGAQDGRVYGFGDRLGANAGGLGDTGGASRFFYTAKASRAEREAGLSGTTSNVNDGRATSIDNPYQRGDTQRLNTHPTVKPIALMQWLVRLVTPPGGTVLDPFCGSGSTLIAADREGFDAIGIELSPEYAAIARDRAKGDCPLFAEVEHEEASGLNLEEE